MLQAIDVLPKQSQLVYERIREALRDGQIEGGSILNEARLARDLGVSKTPVRESLMRLASEGFVRILPRRGIEVVALSLRDIEEVFDVREMLEVEGIRLALPRLDDSTLAKLEEILERAGQVAESGTFQARFDLDVELHNAIAEASGNRRLVKMLNDNRVWVQRIRIGTFENRLFPPGRSTRSHKEHVDLINALRDRDLGATDLVRHHISSLKQEITDALKARGQDFI
jgi:DNA-binding GntR family transcriptional regulator